MSSLRLAIVFSVLDKYLGQVLAIVTTAIMARLLTPAETGLYLVAQAFLLLAENFREFGVCAYIVQVPELNRTVLRTSFTITALTSWAIGAVIYLSGNAVAAFYGNPDLPHLLHIAALGFVVAPFGSPAVALLRRDLDFRAIAAINVISATAIAVVTVALGFIGYGAASYFWAYAAGSILLAGLAIRRRPDLGIFQPSLHGARTILSFGLTSSVVTVTNLAYDMLPKLALGKILGFDAVGLFTRAVTICQLPDRLLLSGLTPVILPAMADHRRNGGDLRAIYVRGYSFMSAVQWPALLMLALLADPVVQVLLGSQWGQVPPLVRLLALAAMTLAPAFMTYPLLVATGHIRYALYATFLSLPPAAAILVLAAHHGLTAVAASAFVTAPLQMLIALLFIRRAIGMPWKELGRASMTSLAITAATVAIPLAVVGTSPTGLDLDWGRTVLAVLGGALGWGIALRLARHPLLAEVVGIGHRALRRVRPATPAPVGGLG
ncbi:oligosaccharide flippase family protein [Rubellimicrobium aerolatum]|uniref:Oligosaccharide flippase family protein n=1 Tax=Rubellimicrobium aerolatum TaxID=490979 RepID=A0ABW0SE73_9RHOB|nr:oligosaccharide flippase family protein [Rubellimicrobium aerolatum]MBP1806816.1 O-antigen/teichoic acid export membrane protein [Rubellimicrobium aerolatum]